MSGTQQFIIALIKERHTHLCVVPCSYAGKLTNASINSSNAIEYLTCASEAVACSIAAGLALSDKRLIVLAQSPGLTIMGIPITSLLLPYLIHFSIIVSRRIYLQGENEIQHANPVKHLLYLIGAYGYDWQILCQDDEREAISQIFVCDSKPRICILENKTFGDGELDAAYLPDLVCFPKVRCISNHSIIIPRVMTGRL